MKKFLFLLFTTTAFNIFSQTVLNEQFNYGATAGILGGSGGVSTAWRPYLNAGTVPVGYTNTSLVYTGYSGATVGSGAATFANGSSSRESVNQQVPLTNSGNVYLSFLVKVSGGSGITTTQDYVIHFNDTFGSTLTSTAVGRFFIRWEMLVPGYKIGISKASAAPSATTTTLYTTTTTYLVVMRYMFNTASSIDDSLYAWIFSSGVPATEPAPTLIATDMTVPDIAQIRSVCIRQGNVGSAAGAIDAMKVGLTWASTVLPVTWLDVNATRLHGSGNRLEWSTASEINNHHFEIERSSDNQNWETVGMIQGAGNSQSVVTYNFNDLDADETTEVFYRIRQVDNDGKYSWSKVVAVAPAFIPERDALLFPNPFSDVLTASASSHILIRDLHGISQMEEDVPAGKSLNASTLVPVFITLQ
jgi:hypothetical protein